MNPCSCPACFSALIQFRIPTKRWYHTQWVCLLTLINIMKIISLVVLDSAMLTTLTITDLDTTHHKTLLDRVCIHATSALRRQRREGCEFQAGLDYMRPCLKRNQSFWSIMERICSWTYTNAQMLFGSVEMESCSNKTISRWLHQKWKCFSSMSYWI